MKKIKDRILQFGLFKSASILLFVIFITLYFFKDKIRDHRVTRAKVEMFKRMMDTEPQYWDEELKQVYDSLLIQKDTTG